MLLWIFNVLLMLLYCYYLYFYGATLRPQSRKFKLNLFKTVKYLCFTDSQCAIVVGMQEYNRGHYGVSITYETPCMTLDQSNT